MRRWLCIACTHNILWIIIASNQSWLLASSARAVFRSLVSSYFRSGQVQIFAHTRHLSIITQATRGLIFFLRRYCSRKGWMQSQAFLFNVRLLLLLVFFFGVRGCCYCGRYVESLLPSHYFIANLIFAICWVNLLVFVPYVYAAEVLFVVRRTNNLMWTGCIWHISNGNGATSRKSENHRSHTRCFCFLHFFSVILLSNCIRFCEIKRSISFCIFLISNEYGECVRLYTRILRICEWFIFHSYAYYAPHTYRLEWKS